jgi:hypothetical protein
MTPYTVTPVNTLHGWDGDDTLEGGDGDDELFGGVGIYVQVIWLLHQKSSSFSSGGGWLSSPK